VELIHWILQDQCIRPVCDIHLAETPSETEEPNTLLLLLHVFKRQLREEN
jgi:hypothetical protein